MAATVTMMELSLGIEDANTNPSCKTVLTGVLSDFMDLTYKVESPYTTGQQVLPSGCTIEDVNNAIADETTKKRFKDIFLRIADKVKSGDITPQVNDGTWDSKLTPVLVLVSVKDE